MKTNLETVAREALARPWNKSIDELQSLAQGYLDLLAENENRKLTEAAQDSAAKHQDKIIAQLKSENESLREEKNIVPKENVIAFLEQVKKLQSDSAKLIDALKLFT